MPLSPSTNRPLRVAVIGAGAAGFFTAEALLKQGFSVTIDIFEKLPAPFGLVRYGVAPDHPKIKNVIKVFEKIAGDKRVSYFGNVKVGADISVKELKKFYDAIVFCYGAEEEKRLSIKGEALKGSYRACEFVGWYNGHPQYSHGTFDFSHRVAVVMGLGNVALDISRILCSSTDELAKTDICQHALDVLSESKIREVHMYGRRGAFYAAFTPLELMEMGQLSDCCPVVDAQELELDPAALKELESATQTFHKKNLEILRAYTMCHGTMRKKTFFLHFNRSPVELIGQSHLEKIRFEINKQGYGTGQYEEIDAGAFFSSIGFLGVSMEGLPFLSNKGVLPNNKGRIIDGEKPMPGLYAGGWIASGAMSVIGVTKLRVQETVSSLIEDLPGLPGCEIPNTQALVDLLKTRQVFPITFIDWKKIDAYEIKQGLKLGKPREKLTTVAQMIAIAQALVVGERSESNH